MFRSVARNVGRPMIPSSHGSAVSGQPRSRTKKIPVSRYRAVLQPVSTPVTKHVKRAVYVSKDETVRRVAKEAAAMRPSSKHIRKFYKAVRTYCGCVLRYHHTTVTAEYLYLRLRRFIENERQLGKSVNRKILEAHVESIYADIELRILNMARYGHRIKAELHKDRYAIMASFREQSGRKCFLVCEDGPDGFPFILCIQTPRQFNQKRRTHIQKRKEYRNYHPKRRKRSETIH